MDGRYFLVAIRNDFRGDLYMGALTEHADMISKRDPFSSPRDPRTFRSSTPLPDKERLQFWRSIEGFYTIMLSQRDFRETKKEHFEAEPLQEPNLINTYTFRHTQDPMRHLGDIPCQITFVMLNNLDESQITSDAEAWALIFKSPETDDRRMPTTKIIDREALAPFSPGVQKIMDRISVRTLSEDFVEAYARRIADNNDAFADIAEKMKPKEL